MRGDSKPSHHKEHGLALAAYGQPFCDSLQSAEEDGLEGIDHQDQRYGAYI